MMAFYEDVPVGARRQLGAHTFTAEEIKRFAAAYDPQPFHTDEEAAAKTHFGRLCASGWHTLAVWMQLNVRDMKERAAAAPPTASGARAARLGPSPGFDDLKWLRPVYAGDTISYESEIVAKRESRSRPEWGLISIRNVGRNQSGEEAISFTAHVFVERRGDTPESGE